MRGSPKARHFPTIAMTKSAATRHIIPGGIGVSCSAGVLAWLFGVFLAGALAAEPDFILHGGKS